MEPATTPSASSLSSASCTRNLSGHEVTILYTDNVIFIEAETPDSQDIYAATLQNDDLQEAMMKYIFEDMSRLYRILVKALENASQASNLSLSDQMVLSYPVSLDIGGEKMTCPLSVQLHPRELNREEQLERGLKKANKCITELKNEVKTLTALVGRSVIDRYTCRDLYQVVNTKFDAKCKNKNYATFSNTNLSIVAANSDGWHAIHTTEALPTSGRFRFSVKINNTSANRNIMVGVAHKDQRDAETCHLAQGSYFLSLANNHIYRHPSHTATNKARQAVNDDLITVFIDMDNELVAFYIGEECMSHIKTNFVAFGNKGFYPCVHLHTVNDGVTLVSN